MVDYASERRLMVGNQTQSAFPLDGNWASLEKRVWGYMALAVTEGRAKQDVLLLGLGGGTLLHFIHQQAPSSHVTCVELDPAIVYVAGKYFGIDNLPWADVVIGDAGLIVAKPEMFLPKARFDAIVVDTFIGSSLPGFMAEASFFIHLKNLLPSGGRVVINRIMDKKRSDAQQDFLDKLGGYFVNLKVIEVPSFIREANLVFVGEKE